MCCSQQWTPTDKFHYGLIYLFLVHLTMLSIAKIILHQMTRWFVNELEKMEKAVMT